MSTSRGQNRKNERLYSAQGIAGVIGVLIFFIGCLGAGIFAHNIAGQNDRAYNDRLDQQVSAIRVFTEDRFTSYYRMLLAERLFITTKTDFTSADLGMFYDHMDVARQFPSVDSIGYAAVLNPQDVSGYEQTQRAAGFPDFAVHPEGSTETQYAPIAFVEPLTTANRLALGYDMYSEAMRRSAMQYARDADKPALTPPLHLVADTGPDSSNLGLVMYLPVYDTATSPTTVEDRRAHLKGYVYLTVKPISLVQQYIGQSNSLSGSELSLHDVTTNTATKFFSINPLPPHTTDVQSSSQTYQNFNRLWKFTISSRNDRLRALLGPSIVFGLGVIASIVTGFVASMILYNRLGKVEASYEKAMRRSKDELLALASHQLRTPASGVKQYIGMLHQGFAGELTDKQKEIVRKAYDANERQLGIINELLYVSKLDAGQIHLEPNEMDLTALARYIVEGFTTQAQTKNIELIFHAITPRNIVADARYISMIIENLVSNAIKYSPPNSRVTIRMKDVGQNVALMVIDHGVGIDDTDLPRLFEKFERIENPLSQSEGGSGLGLFLAKRLAQAHGGDITVDSTLNRGSTFTLLLPKESHIINEFININNRRPSRRKFMIRRKRDKNDDHQ